MAKPIILLVEDLDDNATLVRKVLTARGYEVLWANTGEKGLDMAVENPPGLILLDLGLPDIDGQTLVQYFRNIPEVNVWLYGDMIPGNREMLQKVSGPI